MFSLHETHFEWEPSYSSSAHLFSSIVFFPPCLISFWIFKQLSHFSTLRLLCFLPHAQKQAILEMQKKRISYFTDVCPALMWRRFIRTHSLCQSASISMLLEFVDSLLKWSRLDGASNVLLGSLESNKSTEHRAGRACVCACLDVFVCKARPKRYIMKPSIKVDDLSALSSFSWE